MFYIKYFAKKLVAISCKFFFTTKFVSIFYEKNFKTKFAGNMSFFSSDSLDKKLFKSPTILKV